MLELVNRLDGKEPAGRLVEKLARYAEIQFQDAVVWLEAAGYPDPAQREFRHRAFRAWLDHNLTAWRSGGKRPSRAAT